MRCKMPLPDASIPPNLSAGSTSSCKWVFLVGAFVAVSGCQSWQPNAQRPGNDSTLLPETKVMVGTKAEVTTSRGGHLQVAPSAGVNLASVNSLYVGEPVIEVSSRDPIISANLESLLAEGAREELTLHLDFPKGTERSGRSLGNNPTATRDEVLEGARRSGSNAALITTVSTYQERVGSDLAVSVPAKVGFTIEVVSTRDGSALWSASYSRQDRAISENLLQSREKFGEPGGLRWESASGLIGAGFREALRSFGEARTRQFLEPAPGSVG
jgi:hypothetical protein